MKIPKLLQLHIIILLWGFTPVLGKAISISSIDLVFYRLLISGIALYIYMLYRKDNLRMSFKQLAEVAALGMVVGIHWYTFYEAIKVSNVSMAMVGFSTITLFAGLIQPLLLNKPFYKGDIIYGVIIAIGLLIVVRAETVYLSGILYGIVSAFTGAFFGVYNGRLIAKHSASKITLIEFAGAIVAIFIIQLILFGDISIATPVGSDWTYLLILSLVCTTLAFTWSIEILKHFTPLTVIITNNLEPVYGVVFSVLLFGSSEYMSGAFYIGATILLGCVFSYPIIKKKYYPL
jgi:drug/metabolite transporter (DMT)-like permease